MPGGPGRIIAIGDVHGCAHALAALVEAIAPTPGDQVVMLGDLIDQGRDSAEVLDQLIELKDRCGVVLIRGNHEEMLLAAREGEEALRYWEVCGGVATLNSYRYGASPKDIPAEHWALLDECRDYYETDDFIFTHANYLPDLPMTEQPAYQLRWALLDAAEAQPHVSGKTVIVGHTEPRDSEILDLGFVICIDTACWRHGWLTALDVGTKRLWQASRFGMLRERDEPTYRGRLPQLAAAGRS
jgi:serine/threonine protein phosphatase 1